MDTFLTVTIALAVLVGILQAVLTLGVWFLTKVRPSLHPFARSSYVGLALCAGVAYWGLTLGWLVSAIVCIGVRDPRSAAVPLVCALIGGVGGTYLVIYAYRGTFMPTRQGRVLRVAWLEVLSSSLEDARFAQDVKSPLFIRAVEELFVPDNIHPEKWLGNWMAFNHVMEYEVSLRGFKSDLRNWSNVTPSARKLLERWWVLPPGNLWFVAAYPDVDLWWDTAMKEAIRARAKGEGDAVSSLEEKVCGATNESDFEKADEDTRNLLGKRLLVHYYRTNVSARLECQG